MFDYYTYNHSSMIVLVSILYLEIKKPYVTKFLDHHAERLT